jgi:predicted site-specific integrase-resolvase
MIEEISNKNMKAVILARVSTQEQTQGESINGQTDRLLEYCKRKNLQIIKSFSIVESSTKGDRKEFQEVIEFIKMQDGIQKIVAINPDSLFCDFSTFEAMKYRSRIAFQYVVLRFKVIDLPFWCLDSE